MSDLLADGRKSEPTHHPIVEREDANIAAVMNVVLPHDWRGKILHPDAGQSVPANLIVLVGALRVVRDVEPDVLAIADITEFYVRIGTGTVDTDSCTH